MADEKPAERLGASLSTPPATLRSGRLPEPLLPHAATCTPLTPRLLLQASWRSPQVERCEPALQSCPPCLVPLTWSSWVYSAATYGAERRRDPGTLHHGDCALQFAPKKPVKKAPKKQAASEGATGAGGSDAFKDLIDQAKQAGRGARRNTGTNWNRDQNLQVAFGGGAGGAYLLRCAARHCNQDCQGTWS